VPVVVRNFQAVISNAIPANGRSRDFRLSIDGVTTRLCLIDVTQIGCTQSGSITVPAGSHVSLLMDLSDTGTTFGATQQGLWGMTVGTS
jgi:hypothetical protein